MFETKEQLQEFILWAIKNKVRHVKVGAVEFTLSNGAIYLPDSNGLSAQTDTSTNTEGESDLTRPSASGSDEEMDDNTLFHSAN